MDWAEPQLPGYINPVKDGAPRWTKYRDALASDPKVLFEMAGHLLKNNTNHDQVGCLEWCRCNCRPDAHRHVDESASATLRNNSDPALEISQSVAAKELSRIKDSEQEINQIVG